MVYELPKEDLSEDESDSAWSCETNDTLNGLSVDDFALPSPIVPCEETWPPLLTSAPQEITPFRLPRCPSHSTALRPTHRSMRPAYPRILSSSGDTRLPPIVSSPENLRLPSMRELLLDLGVPPIDTLLGLAGDRLQRASPRETATTEPPIFDTLADGTSSRGLPAIGSLVQTLCAVRKY